MNMNKDDRIFVAGHRGLVGQAIVRNLQKRGYNNILVQTRQQLDLQNMDAVSIYLREQRPHVVFVAAAKVGGIHANNTFRADFLLENLNIQNNVLWGSHLADVRRVIFLGSSCIYPKLASQPMAESCLLTGPLEPTNRPYAIAKIAGLELIDGLRRQYGRDYFSVMPTNLYGPGDNFDLENSHVLPALIRKIVTAKDEGKPVVEIWGTGKPLREFMYSDDCADAIITVAEKCDAHFLNQLGYSHINIGTGQEISIKDLAHLISRIVGFEGELQFNADRLDGAPRKLLDVGHLAGLGWQPQVSLEAGIRFTIDWYRSLKKS
jgi:GDP-L-fucose synthase